MALNFVSLHPKKPPPTSSLYPKHKPLLNLHYPVVSSFRTDAQPEGTQSGITEKDPQTSSSGIPFMFICICSDSPIKSRFMFQSLYDQYTISRTWYPLIISILLSRCIRGDKEKKRKENLRGLGGTSPKLAQNDCSYLGPLWLAFVFVLPLSSSRYYLETFIQ